jgi:hypothetical protein
LLKSRISYRHADRRSGKSTKRIEEMVCSSFYVAMSSKLNDRGAILGNRQIQDAFTLTTTLSSLAPGLKPWASHEIGESHSAIRVSQQIWRFAVLSGLFSSGGASG